VQVSSCSPKGTVKLRRGKWVCKEKCRRGSGSEERGKKSSKDIWKEGLRALSGSDWTEERDWVYFRDGGQEKGCASSLGNWEAQKRGSNCGSKN